MGLYTTSPHPSVKYHGASLMLWAVFWLVVQGLV